jgi:hypothetical protein
MASQGVSSGPLKVPEWDKWSSAELQAIDGAIRKADPGQVSRAFSRISSNFPQGEWLSQSHIVGDTPRAIKKGPPHGVPLSEAIAEYAAASVPLHVADAWTYFGRAMAAISTGSVEVAQHLLYYCELRAMYGLLFRHGVVLMNSKNFSLTSAGSLEIPFPSSKRAQSVARNEHQAVWVLFRHWAKSPAAASFCEATIRLRGEPLSKWIAERPLPGSLRGVLGELMHGWGLDVARFSVDRELRNQLSYNPTRLRLVPTGVTPEYVAGIYEQVWGLLEPEPSNAFESLDGFIMRDAFAALKKQDPVRRRISLPPGRTMYQHWVESVLGPDAAPSIVGLFDNPGQHVAPDIYLGAGKSLSGQSLAQQLSGMIGRAVILLRFSTGAARGLLGAAGATASDVGFWLEDMLTMHGIRLPDGDPLDFFDLYADVDDSVREIALLNGEAKPEDLALITEELAREFTTLSGFERVPAWAVA